MLGLLSLRHSAHAGSGAPPAYYPVGIQGKAGDGEGETDQSPLSSAEVKNEWIYTSTPPIHLHSVVLN
jgi:hypothetical protein